MHTVSSELIGLVDLSISLLGLAGLKFRQEVDGEDLHRLFTNRDAKGREGCYIFDLVPCHQAAARGGSEWRGLRTRRYTFARTTSDKGYILYDNINDPMQMNNLIGSAGYQSVKNELLQALNRHITRHDKLLPWQQLIREYGLIKEWNRSQRYFKLPLLEGE